MGDSFLRCDSCSDRDSAENPVTALESDRLVTVQCEACRAFGVKPRFARRLRGRSTNTAVIDREVCA